MEGSPSLPFSSCHLSVHLPTCPRHLPARSDKLLSLCPLPARTVTCTHRHAHTHRLILMRMPYYRTNATVPRSSPSATNLCFVKYTNDSINLDLITVTSSLLPPWYKLDTKAASAPQFSAPAKTGSYRCGIAYRYIFIYITQIHTVAQLDRGWPELWCGRQRLFTQLWERREGWEMEGVNEGELCQGWLPCSLSLPLTPPCLSPPPRSLPSYPLEMHTCLEYGGAHTQVCGSVCLCMWTCETAEQKRQTDMHVRLPWMQHPGTPLLFFSLTLTFLLFFFFITVIF